MSQSIKRNCQNLLYSDQDVYRNYIITPSGYIFNCTNNDNGTLQSNYDFQNTDWYQDTLALDGALYISSNAIHDCFTGDKQTIFFAQCLKDIYTHEVVGILMLDCNSRYLLLIIQKPMIFYIATTTNFHLISLTPEVLYSRQSLIFLLSA